MVPQNWAAHLIKRLFHVPTLREQALLGGPCFFLPMPSLHVNGSQETLSYSYRDHLQPLRLRGEKRKETL